MVGVPVACRCGCSHVMPMRIAPVETRRVPKSCLLGLLEGVHADGPQWPDARGWDGCTALQRRGGSSGLRSVSA